MAGENALWYPTALPRFDELSTWTAGIRQFLTLGSFETDFRWLQICGPKNRNMLQQPFLNYRGKNI
jgi:hypothetical protein